jgi:hypothetical protein
MRIVYNRCSILSSGKKGFWKIGGGKSHREGGSSDGGYASVVDRGYGELVSGLRMAVGGEDSSCRFGRAECVVRICGALIVCEALPRDCIIMR